MRDWARQKGEIYVITGAVFDRNDDGSRDDDDDAVLVEDTEQGTDRVAVPSHFYKIILHERPNTFIESMTFLLPHTDESISGRTRANKFLRDHLTTIDEIEDLTGMDFLVGLTENAAKERAIERSRAQRLWARE